MFGEEAIGVGLFAEEPMASYAVETATDVGDEADDGAVAMDWREVGDGGSGTAFAVRLNRVFGGAQQNA